MNSENKQIKLASEGDCPKCREEADRIELIAAHDHTHCDACGAFLD